MADGKPNLTAPAPRSADGKPDVSGLWAPAPNLYWIDVIQDPRDEAIFRPEAEAIFKARVADYSRGAPLTHCLPLGPADIFTPYRIVQSPTVISVLFASGRYREIFMDGRPLPNDPNPTWQGYSIGHWEGDTLVVETTGFNDRGWLDQLGHPHSESLRVTERFQRIDFGHMRLQVTLEDPQTFTKPLSISLTVNYSADNSTLEYVCEEGERDADHLVAGTGKPKVQVPPAILAKYAGAYDFREGIPGSQNFFGRTIVFTLQDGQLYLKAFPLIPKSETDFDSGLVPVQFVVDAGGSVTQVILSRAEGDARYDRKP